MDQELLRLEIDVIPHSKSAFVPWATSVRPSANRH